MINHREFTIAYLGLCLLRYDTEPFALRDLRQNDSLFETKRILFLVALRYPYYTRVYYCTTAVAARAFFQTFGGRTIGISMAIRRVGLTL